MLFPGRSHLTPYGGMPSVMAWGATGHFTRSQLPTPNFRYSKDKGMGETLV